MSDIGLTWDPSTLSADFEFVANDLSTDAGLKTAIELSLFTDRRAEDGDVLPVGETDRRGWCLDDPTDKIGSRLWLLARSKQSQEILVRAPEYVKEALQWLIDDKVSDRIEVDVLFPRRGMYALVVGVYRPGRDVIRFRYNRTWDAQGAA